MKDSVEARIQEGSKQQQELFDREWRKMKEMKEEIELKESRVTDQQKALDLQMAELEKMKHKTEEPIAGAKATKKEQKDVSDPEQEIAKGNDKKEVLDSERIKSIKSEIEKKAMQRKIPRRIPEPHQKAKKSNGQESWEIASPTLQSMKTSMDIKALEESTQIQNQEQLQQNEKEILAEVLALQLKRAKELASLLEAEEDLKNRVSLMETKIQMKEMKNNMWVINENPNQHQEKVAKKTDNLMKDDLMKERRKLTNAIALRKKKERQQAELKVVEEDVRLQIQDIETKKIIANLRK